VFDIGLGRNVNNSFAMNVDFALGDKRVRRSALDIPLQGIEGDVIVDSGGPLLLERASKIDDDDNDCGVHASDLVAHRREDNVGIHQGRGTGEVEPYNDLGGLQLKE
jgi:hypothetical protein